MYFDNTVPSLKTAQSRSVCLQGADVHIDIHDYLAHTRMTYNFLNDEDEPIEPVYTFPLPIDGVLTALHIQIGEREMHGTAVEKRQAQEDYEQAVSEGDTPIMLERIDSGLYCLNVGNILPDEQVVVSVEFMEVLTLKADEVRYELPTTLAPLYGNPSERGLEPHQYPVNDLLVDNRMTIKVDIKGCLADAEILTPSHKTLLTKEEGRACLTFSEPAPSMDRDFLIVFRSEALPKAFAISVPDKDGYVVLAGFTPRFATAARARSIKIVVDCSGSMGGESILQAKEGLLRILDRLRPEDHFNIILFGSSSTALFNRQQPAEEKQLKAARVMAQSMDADMGGTEMADALDKALASTSPSGLAEDILLITDGQVWNISSIANNIVRQKHRIFSIGVGPSMERGVLSTLSSRTGGKVIFVSPHEDMGKKVFQHYKRMTLTSTEKPTLGFDGLTPLDLAPRKLGPIFNGDMILSCAWFSTLPEGISFSLKTPEGPISLYASVRKDKEMSELRRFAAALKIQDVPDTQATSLALDFNLVSPYTAYVAVLKREDTDKSIVLPNLKKIAHNIPNNWGGIKSGKRQTTDLSTPMYCRVRKIDQKLNNSKKEIIHTWQEKVINIAIKFAFISIVNKGIEFKTLESWGAPEDILEKLRNLLASIPESARPTEENLGFAFTIAIAKKCNNISRDDIRLIRKTYGPENSILTKGVKTKIQEIATECFSDQCQLYDKKNSIWGLLGRLFKSFSRPTSIPKGS
jgi:Ca-activated chloride channel family protein